MEVEGKSGPQEAEVFSTRAPLTAPGERQPNEAPAPTPAPPPVDYRVSPTGPQDPDAHDYRVSPTGPRDPDAHDYRVSPTGGPFTGDRTVQAEESLADQFLTDEPAPAAAGGGTIADSFLTDTPDTGRLSAAMKLGSQTTPDAAAETLRLSKLTGLPEDLVGRNLEPLREEERQKKAGTPEQLFDTAPIVASWLAESANRAALVHDDLHNVKKLEEKVRDYGTLRRLGETFKSSTANMLAGVAHIPEFAFGAMAFRFNLGRQAAEDAGAPYAKQLEAPAALKRAIDPIAQTFEREAQRLAMPEQSEKVSESLVRGDWKGAAYLELFRIAEFAPQGLALLAAAITGNGGAAATALSALAGGDAQKRAQDSGASPATATMNATGNAAAEYFGDKLPSLGLFEYLKKRVASKVGQYGFTEFLKAFGLTVLGASAGEGVQEGVTQGVQSFIDYTTGVDPSALDDLKMNVFEAFLAGAGAGGSMHGPAALGAGFRARATQAQTALARDFYNSMGATAEATKLRERLPEAQKELIERIVKDGPVERVYIPIEAFDSVLEAAGENPAGVAQALGVAQSYQEAKDGAGAHVEIPLAVWTDKVLGTPQWKAFENDVKFDPEHLTVNEFEALTKQLQDEAKKAEEAKPEQAPVEDAKADAENLESVVYKTLGETMGMDPEAVKKTYPLEKRDPEAAGSEQGPAPTLEQPALNVRPVDDKAYSYDEVLASAHKTGNYAEEAALGDLYGKDKPSFRLVEVPVALLYRGDWERAPGERAPIERPSEPMFLEAEEDEGYAQKYAAKYPSGETAEPILVALEGGRIEILDGRHRARAAFLRGEPFVRAFVVQGQAKTFDQSSLPAVPAAPGATVSPLGFYSQLEDAVLKMDFKSMPAQQLAQTIKNIPGIKAEEIEWTGLFDYLAGRRGKVSKENVLAFLQTHTLAIEEVQRGPEQAQRIDEAEKAVVALARRQGIGDPEGYALDIARGELSESQVSLMSDEMRPLADALRTAFKTREERLAGGASPVKFSGWSIDGGENYREVLLVLPTREAAQVGAAQAEFVSVAQAAGLSEEQIDFYVSEYRLGGAKIEFLERNAPAAIHAAGRKLRESVYARNEAESQQFRGAHWDEPNVLVHLRMDDRTDADGKRVLFVQEAQSDWHQAGRKKGYQEASPITPEQEAIYKKYYAAVSKQESVYWKEREDAAIEKGLITPEEAKLAHEIDQIKRDFKKAQEDAVPSAPFKKTWHELAMKRAIRVAVEGGYDRIAWSNGDIISDALDITKMVDGVRWQEESSTLFVSRPDEDAWEPIVAVVTRDNLAEYIGKELAEKMLTMPPVDARGFKQRRIEGLELKVGGEGNRVFYDKILVGFMKKLGKKYGATVGTIQIPVSPANKFEGEKLEYSGPELTPDQVRAAKDRADTVSMHFQFEDVAKAIEGGKTTKEAVEKFGSLSLAEAIGGTAQWVAAPEMEPVHSMDLTPALRASVMSGQTLFQKDRQDTGPRGQITLGNAKAVLSILQTGDPSTRIHELAHYWLELLARFVEAGNASPKVQGYLNTVQDWWKEKADHILESLDKSIVDEKDEAKKARMVKMRAEILERGGADYIRAVADNWRGQAGEVGQFAVELLHEYHARGHEAYFMEGRAPSPELRSVFERFREWLYAIYKELEALNVELTPEARQAFATLFATDEQIRQAETEAGIGSLFSDPKAAGFTDQEAAGLEQATADVRAASRAELNGKLQAQEKRRQSRAYRAKEAEVRAEVEKEVAERREQLAFSVLSRGTLPDGSEIPESQTGGFGPGNLKAIKLDRDAIAAEYGEERLKELPRPYVYAREGGIHPDVAAQVFGFSSGDELLAELTSVEPFETVVEREVSARMLVEFGDMRTDGSMPEEALRAAHTEKRAQLMQRELELMLSKRKGTFRKTTRTLAARPRTQAAVKAQAEALINSKKVRDINPALYQRAEAKAQREAIDAWTKGDVEAAIAAQERKILNFHLYRAATAARDRVERTVDYMARFLELPNRQRLGKAGQEYLEQVDSIIERFDFKKSVTLSQVDKRQALAKWVENQRAMGFDPVLPEKLLNEAFRTHYKDLPYGDLLEIADGVRNIEKLARLKNKLLKANERRELEAAVDEAVASVEAHSKGARPREVETRLPQHELFKAGAGFIASHRKFANFIRQMDGYEDGGVMWELFVRPMNEAGNTEAVRREEATKKLGEIFSVYSTKEIASMYVKRFIPEANLNLTRMGMIAVALNWGNQDSRQKLMDGYGWNERQVQAILDRLDSKDVAVVNQLWEFINSFWPETKALSERVTGVAPEKVEAAPFEAKNGKFSGGYFPLKYDSRQSPKAYSHLAKEQAERAMHGGAVRATTKHGHREARVQGVKLPIRLDFGPIFEHVTEVIHDLTHYEFLIDANRLLGHRRLQEKILEHYGDEVYGQLRDAIQDVAAGDVPSQLAFEKAINWLRTGSSIAAMGWSVMTTLAQPFGITQSMVRIGPKWVAKGMSRWLGDARRMEKTTEWVYERSPFMRLRAKTQMREISEIRGQLRLKGKVLGEVENSYFWLISRGQLLVDIPTWLGAYEKAMETERGLEGKALEDRAIALADQAVLDSQGGGQVKDLAQIQRGGPLLKLWTNFYSFFNTTFNLTYESAGRTDWKKPSDLGRFAVDMLLLYSAPAILGELLKSALRGGDDDKDKLPAKLVGAQASYLMGTMVGLREFSGFAQGFSGYEGPAGARGFAAIGKLAKQVQQGELDESFWRSANQAAGILFHYPSGQLERLVRGFMVMEKHPLAPLVGPPPKRK